jgi:hypothetical protein
MTKHEEYFFKGKGSYFPNLQQGDLGYKNWNVRLHFDDASYNLFMKLKEPEGDVAGILNEVKKDEDGYYHTFKRPMFKNFGHGDEPLTPPIILDKDNQSWDRNVDIGAGSDITVKVECYKYKNRMSKKPGRAIRMAAVRVDNLVPATTDDFNDVQKRQIRGMDGQPGQPF